MKTRYLALAAILMIWSGMAGAQEPVWRQVAVGDWTSGNFLTPCMHPQGGYLILGSANSWQSGTRTALIRLNAQGDTLWTKAYWRGDLGDRWPVDMAAATDGSGFFLLLGNGIPSIQYNTVMKVDLQGDSLWQTIVSNNTDAWVNAPFNALTSTDDGGCVIAGNGYFFDNPPLVTKLDGSGQILWTNAVSPSGAYSLYQKVRQGPTGDLFAVGTHSSYDPGANHSRLMISKLTGTGTLLWAKTFNSGTTDSGDMRRSEGHDVLPLPDGGCIVTGFVTDPGISFQGQTEVMRLDADGTVVWTKTWFPSPNDLSQGFNLEPAGSDHFLVFLHRYGSTAAGATLMKCDLAGDSLWTQFGWDYPLRLKGRDAAGNLIFTGYVPSSPFGVFIRTSPDGTYRPPGLQDPWNGQGNVVTPYLFQWNTGGSPQVTLQYDLQIAKETTFTAPVAQYTTNGTHTFSVSGLSGQTTYFWRVRARGQEYGPGIWSDPSQFTTGDITAWDQLESGCSLGVLMPQPANDLVRLTYSLDREVMVEILVTDAAGRQRVVEDTGRRSPGDYVLALDVGGWPNGPYLVTLIADGIPLTRPMVIQH